MNHVDCSVNYLDDFRCVNLSEKCRVDLWPIIHDTFLDETPKYFLARKIRCREFSSEKRISFLENPQCSEIRKIFLFSLARHMAWKWKLPKPFSNMKAFNHVCQKSLAKLNLEMNRRKPLENESSSASINRLLSIGVLTAKLTLKIENSGTEIRRNQWKNFI